MNTSVVSPESLDIVLFGGGGGGSVMAKGLQESFPDAHVSVVVPTGDHGGSTGIIRDVLGGPAVGDPSKIITELSGSAAVKTVLETPRFARGSNTDDIRRLNEALLNALPPQANAYRAVAILDGAVEVGKELMEKHGKQLQGHSYRNIALTAIRLYTVICVSLWLR
ncbi:MAG TPA: 2-phospho-L-lactate transferase CofD family protein [Candidatus Saccharimonadales bacterium]|nr:2-phospho-L-lactate transferase CofD family protein [Candidatus Saccharimonadales bacterium]